MTEAFLSQNLSSLATCHEYERQISLVLVFRRYFDDCLSLSGELASVRILRAGVICRNHTKNTTKSQSGFQFEGNLLFLFCSLGKCRG